MAQNDKKGSHEVPGMKPLSLYQASTCESAREPVCKCRCQGALHGARRGGEAMGGTVDTAFFEGLSESDPHYVPSDLARKTKARAARAAEVLAGKQQKSQDARERFHALQRRHRGASGKEATT